MSKSSNQIIELQDDQATLIDLYKKSQQIKLTKTPYYELTLFKQQLRNRIPRSFSYDFFQRKVNYYRLIFFAFAFLFVLLGAILMENNIAISGFLLSEIKPLIKGSLVVFTLALTLSSIAIGYSLCVAREATTSIVTKTKKQILQVYRCKCIEHGKNAALKSAYHDILHTIHEHQEYTYKLLWEVLQAKYNKEMLFGQALIQLDEKLQQEVLRFKKFKGT